MIEVAADVGLGLAHGVVRLARTTPAWIAAGEQLREHVAAELVGLVAAVEQIGSSSVPDLLAKPIVDLAVGLTTGQELVPVHAVLEHDSWIYRGDAGEHGGHVFVYDTRPLHRVAHLHVVEHEGRQWRHYLQLRDLLRTSANARAEYESVKLELHRLVGDDRVAYTDGKTDVIRRLLASTNDRRHTG